MFLRALRRAFADVRDKKVRAAGSSVVLAGDGSMGSVYFAELGLPEVGTTRFVVSVQALDERLTPEK